MARRCPHRMSIRPKHLEHAAEGFKLGWIGASLPRVTAPLHRLNSYLHDARKHTVKAGATFADDSRTQMTGSWFVLREESLEKARERLARDVYATDGAWDMSKVVDLPLSLYSYRRAQTTCERSCRVHEWIYLSLIAFTCNGTGDYHTSSDCQALT